MEVPGKVEKKSILEEASLFLEDNKGEISHKVVKYYKRYIPAYSSFSHTDFLEEVREEVLERISLIAKHLNGEKGICHLSSECFKKLVERRLIQGIPFSEFLGAYVVGKNIIINALKREFLPRALEKEEIFQFFQAVGDATESILIPMALSYADTQEYLDPLTRLFNHSYFQESLNEELQGAKEETAPLSIALINIDHFRQLNESCGYRQSDIVLREVSQILFEMAGSDDILSRYGADTFAVIMLRRPKGQALKTAKKIRKSIEEHEFYIYGNGTKKVTVSIGLSSCPEDGSSRFELIEKAFSSLKEAKESGRNTVVAGKSR